MAETGESRAALVGGVLSAAALLLFLGGLLFNGPLPGDADRFSPRADLLLGGLALLTAWLLAGSAFWARGEPAWARRARRLWEIPFLALVGGFMLWVRLLPYRAFVGGDRVYYIGTDPYYHYRETLGIVRDFPRVPRWDPWTFYPFGTGTGQFGSLFDWTAAAFVVLTRGRDATEAYVQQVLGTYPAVLGALLIVPFYFLAKRMMGAPAAIVASIVLALLPGEFLERSLAGYADHHVVEALFCLVSILGVYVAAMKGHAMRERFASWRTARRPIAWGALGGLGLAANFYAWPPAVLFLVILTIWLTVVVLLEDGKEGGDARGYALGGAVAFATAGVLMLPAIESTALGDFNTFGILHPIACFGAALSMVLLAAGSTAMRRLGKERLFAAVLALALGALAVATGFALAPTEGWMIALLGLAALGVVAGFGAVFVVQWRDRRGLLLGGVGLVVAAAAVVGVSFVARTDFFASVRWGLSWVTGIGVQRTTFTIGEARPSAFFCSADERASGAISCLDNDFGLLAQVSVLVLAALFVWTLVKRRAPDILLLLWSVVIFQATRTQIRFSYYLALNLALLAGWVAARVSEGTGLEAALEGKPATAAAAPKGRKAKRIEEKAKEARAWQMGAVALAVLLVVPGNVFASKDSHGNPTSYTVWEHANMAPASGAFYGRAGEVALWAEGLDWMRTHTPDAGVDLAALVPKPPPGQLYDYPKQAYGVLTWWDYGHWIETIAERPPVANPFQQAAPFAAEWFTERDPERAEKLLDDWVQGKGPVRYVFIDDAIATGKFGAISVWAHSRNESRDVWADRDYRASATYQTSDGPKQLTTTGPEWEESMMGRLYDHDGNGLSHYRLVWEDPSYEVIGSASASDGGIECLHESLPGRGCPAGEPSKMAFIPQGTAINIDRSDGSHDYVYDTIVASRLKLFERVAGAHVRGKAAPGATVTIGARVAVQAENVTPTRGAFDYSITGTAGPDGTFDIVFPYSNAAFVAPKDGGTSLSAHVVGSIVVSSPGSGQAVVTVPDAAVLRGAPVEVPALK